MGFAHVFLAQAARPEVWERVGEAELPDTSKHHPTPYEISGTREVQNFFLVR